jgi:formiminoglutamate deiminase
MSRPVGQGNFEMRQLWFEQALLPSGWARDVAIEIEGEVIASVGVGAAAPADAERHAIAVPGAPNLHSHAFQRAAAGRTGRPGPQGDSFWTWRTEIYRLAAALTPEAAEAIAALAYAEMLESGFTHVGEFHYLHHRPGGAAYDDPAEMSARALQAAEAVGIDITLLPVFYAHSDVGGAAPRPDQARFVCDLDRYGALIEACRVLASRQAGASVGVAPHSLRAVTPDELAVVVSIGADGPIHIHVAEQTAEVARCEAVLGARPVAWLLGEQPVDARWCLVHATHVTPLECEAVARSGAAVGLCPITEADLGDGVFPAQAYSAAGGAWGVGSDSNVLIDLAAELRLLEYGQRLTSLKRNVMAVGGRGVGGSLFEAALGGGAQALGAAVPRIAPGAPATLVSLSATDPALAGAEADTVLDAWIFAARRPIVDCVWRRGRLVVKDGVHLQRARIEARFRQAMLALAA